MGEDFDGNMPDVLPGFEKISRSWDKKHDIYGAKILPGEFYVSIHGELITTVLGSCVSACIRDPVLGIGGMNHFMLPLHVQNRAGAWKDTPVSASTRYGNVAMERLINVILANGGKRKNLEIKLFGGGKVLDMNINIGQFNINFVKEYLRTEHFKIETEDVGGIYPRKVMYYPSSGRARIKKLYKLHNETILKREKAYNDKLESEEIVGDVELF
ncbi:MAG: chemoreceptor glutamine deamidase CheD [Gammaproteobacteria bacterium]